MSNVVASYIKSGSAFIPISEFAGPIPDEDYVEGAIELTVSDVPILTLEHFDLVDQLWAYLLDAVSQTTLRKKIHFYFPDQPLRFEIQPLNQDLVLVSIAERRVSVVRSEFLQTVGAGAEHFFREINRLIPRRQSIWDRYMAKAREVAAI